MNQIKNVFDEAFKHWDIQLPEADLQVGKRGSIREKGWCINYRYYREGDQDRLEYFASHRMTNDSLSRIFADGKRELIGYCQEFYLVDDPKAEQEYFEHNRQFYNQVAARGLDNIEHQETKSELDE